MLFNVECEVVVRYTISRFLECDPSNLTDEIYAAIDSQLLGVDFENEDLGSHDSYCVHINNIESI